MRRLVPRRVLLTLAALALAVTALGMPVAAGAVPAHPLTPSAGPYFGPVLDWTGDDARAYTDRLGAPPALFGQTVGYPLAGQDIAYLHQFVGQVAQQGALALLTVEPRTALSRLTAADADALVDELATLHEQNDTDFYVRFAPEMNGSWRAWGQQPQAYVSAFRTVAAAVHRRLPRDAAQLVWAPAYGAGYPFTTALGRVPGAGPRPVAELDTNGDGAVDARDDPYRPYYPGDDAADWVGLSLFDYGRDQHYGTNVLPEPGKYAALLAGTYGYPSGSGPGRDFVGTYVVAKHKPMAVETGALFNPAQSGGPSELALKQAWWRQVLDPAVRQRYPAIGLVAWLEQSRPEAELRGARVDWRATHTSALAAALLHDLRSGGLTLGTLLPVHDQSVGNSATAQVRESRDAHGDQMGWIVFCAVLLMVLFLVAGLVGRLVPAWRYVEADARRDRRLDVFRGWTIVAVVITHIEVGGPYTYVTLNAAGAIAGAEMFVLLSGIVLGTVYPVAVRRLGSWPAATAMLRRAGRLYLTALAVVVAVYLLSLVPFIDANVLTTFTDRGTGAGGSAAQGRVYDLYALAPHLLDYPPPWYAVRELLFLRMGPWAFNIMGLFVVLSAVVPGLAWLIRRGYWWLVLAGSWALYILDAYHDVRIFHAQFEDVFPLLTWQIAFTHGLVIGYYRRQIIAALTGRIGRIALTATMMLYVGGLAVLWLGHHYGFTVPLAPSGLYDTLYGRAYQRIYLQPGRLVDLAFVLVVAYAVLTAFWKPIDRTVAWFYEPLGRHSLFVFVIHVFVVLAVGNVGALDRSSAWQGFVVHTVALALIWVIVRATFRRASAQPETRAAVAQRGAPSLTAG